MNRIRNIAALAVGWAVGACFVAVNANVAVCFLVSAIATGLALWYTRNEVR